MIKRPDRRVIEALVSLEHNNHFKDVVDWLQESLTDRQEQCMNERDTDDLRRAQGSAITLSEILTAARDARDVMRQMREHK